MSAKSKSQTARVARIQKALSGTQKYLASVPSLILAAVTYTPAQLEAALQAYPTAVTGRQLLHAQLHSAVTAEKAQATQMDELLEALESLVANMFGPKAEQLTEFGFAPRKVTVLTAAEKAEARAKADATRKAKKAALDAVSSAATPPATPAVSSGTPAKS
jgi:hypothetical protein